MSEAAHTPGPWSIVDREDDAWRWEGFPHPYEVGSEAAKTGAAFVFGEANARLIASAPDMLEALECIYATTSNSETRELAEDAIAKATGKS
jgi:hypothetical protein